MTNKKKNNNLPSEFGSTPIGKGFYNLKKYEIKYLPNGLCQVIRKKDGKIVRGGEK